MPNLELHGVTIPLNDAISQTVREHMQRKSFELPEAQAVFRLLEPHDVVLELGTGCGFLAVYCAQRCSGVVTVEADPRMKDTIDGVLNANGVQVVSELGQGTGKAPRVVSLFGAVTRTGERRRLHTAEDFWATRTSKLDSRYPGPDVEVEGLALADLIERYAPSVLVIDIEGAERELGGPLPKHVRAVVVEVHDGATFDVAEWLTAEGFALDGQGPAWCGTWLRILNETAQP